MFATIKTPFNDFAALETIVRIIRNPERGHHAQVTNHNTIEIKCENVNHLDMLCHEVDFHISGIQQKHYFSKASQTHNMKDKMLFARKQKHGWTVEGGPFHLTATFTENYTIGAALWFGHLSLINYENKRKSQIQE